MLRTSTFGSTFGFVDIVVTGWGTSMDELPGDEFGLLLDHIMSGAAQLVNVMVTPALTELAKDQPFGAARIKLAKEDSVSWQGTTVKVGLTVRHFAGVELMDAYDVLNMALQGILGCVLHSLDDPTGEKEKAQAKENPFTGIFKDMFGDGGNGEEPDSGFGWLRDLAATINTGAPTSAWERFSL